MTFFAVYVTLYLLHRYRTLKISAYNRTRKTALAVRVLQSMVVLSGASLVCTSRIYLRYHTTRQVLAGSGTGAVLGIAWYITVIVLRYLGIVDWVLQWRVVEMLWIKDGDIGSLEHDLYEEWLEWRAQRNKEKVSKVKVG
jgi:dolichyldiphosphatase